jgi:YgiT-type zinc finger domain-containing protein
MEKGVAPFSTNRNGYHIAWDAIPAWVCTQCGEPYFEAEQINHIQNALTQVDLETGNLSAKHV